MYNPNQGKRTGGGWKGGSKFGQNKPWDRGFGGQSSRPPMFKATCAECGDSCEVPFRPSAGRDVFCSNCFKKDENAGPQRFGGSDSRRPSFEDRQMYNATCAKCGKGCEVPFRPTGAKPIYCKQCLGTISAPENRGVEFAEQFKAVNAKLDVILKALGQATPSVKAVEKSPAKEVKEAVIPKKVEVEAPKKAAKAKAPAKKAKKKAA